MKLLRIVRISLAALAFVASAAALLMGAEVHPVARLAEKSQIILSSLSITAGTAIVWLLLTFLFGRVYCSTVCPVGTMSDLFLKIRRLIPGLRHKPFRYRPRSKVSVHILWVYVVCLVAGVVGVPFLIEPWNIMRNMAATVRPEAVSATWATIGMGTITGVVGGLVAAILIAVTSVLRGREFCTVVCPLGTALGYVSAYSLYHLEIDRDKCVSCGLCEDICRSQCVKMVSRHIDDTRCVRCFDCVAKCPNDAIRFQVNRNRPATPLMLRAKKRSGT